VAKPGTTARTRPVRRTGAAARLVVVGADDFARVIAAVRGQGRGNHPQPRPRPAAPALTRRPGGEGRRVLG
jgi:hypothetical protein